jgi:formylglycine-generating enzyme required for sulfatase activity
MVRLDAARFYRAANPPRRQVTLGACYISKFAVTNRQFAEFVRAVGYRTEAERFGWSFVFHNHVPEPVRGPTMPGAPWWLRIDRADWAHPEGPDSSVLARRDHPVVQVSWNDALAYCAWAATGCRPKPSGNTPHAAVLTRIPTPKAAN